MSRLENWCSEGLRFMQDASEFHPQYYTTLWNHIRSCLESTENICDAGCGAGYLSLEMAKDCKQVTAIDCSTIPLNLLRKNAPSNLSVVETDIFSYTPETPFGAMIFCQFGSIEEILTVAKAQCAGQIVIIARNQAQRRFSVDASIRAHRTTASFEAVLAGIPHQRRDFTVEFGQPFRSLDDAISFFRLYNPDTTIDPQWVIQQLVEIHQPPFAYYLPKEKHMSILTLQVADVR